MIDFFLNDKVIEYTLNTEQEVEDGVRLLEDGSFRLLEDEDLRILE